MSNRGLSDWLGPSFAVKQKEDGVSYTVKTTAQRYLGAFTL